jgi:hypothetical protein
MNEVVKAYLFIPSGFRNFIERGFDGWRFVFYMYFAFSAILAIISADSPIAGIFIFLQPVFVFVTLSALAVITAFIMGAHEPLIKSMRLVGLCLPPIGLCFFFLAEKTPLVFFAVYPGFLFIVGSIFLRERVRIAGILPAIAVVAITAVLAYYHSTSLDRWFGQELTFDGYRLNLSRAAAFSKDESRVYLFLLKATPSLGYIPQVDEIADSLTLDRTAVRNALMKLDEMGRIVLGANTEIRYAYPWSSFDNGYEVIIESDNSPIPKRAFAASAMHALSVPMIIKSSRIKVLGKLKDTGDPIAIEITDGKIQATNFPEAQVYKSDIFSEMEFYSSPAGAKNSYRGRFDSKKLLNLERALLVSEEMARKKADGLL